MVRLGRHVIGVAVTAATMLAVSMVHAEDIVVTGYGAVADSFPYTVAVAKGFFKQCGADVTGIVASEGGGSTVRNMIGGNLSFGEANFASVVTAKQQGADIKIIAATGNSVGELNLGARPESGIKTLQDIKGKKLGYTEAKSTTQVVSLMLVALAGLQPSEVPMLRTGGAGQTLVALDNGLIDAALIQEPLWSANKSKYVEIPISMPPLTENFAITTSAAAKTKGDFLRGVIKGRRMAVDYMKSNPDDSAVILSKLFHFEPAVMKAALLNLQTPRNGVPYFGDGNVIPAALENMTKALMAAEVITAVPDWKSFVDEEFLPDDLKSH